ncbi:restriction endonuclease subunit R, partial [Epilithonimonas hispanica]
MLSFLELLQMNKKVNNRTLITLNSVSNTKMFLNRYQNYDGKMFLCLSGDRTGNAITMKILTEFNGKNIKDVRPLYEISENGNQDLSEYLDNKRNLQDKNTNLIEPKISENESNAIETGRTSDSQQVGNGTPEHNSGELSPKIQSNQNGSYGRGQEVGSNNAGNGLAVTERSDLGNRDRGRGSNGGTQPQNAQENEGREHSLGGIVSGRRISDRRRPNGGLSEVSENITQNDELETLIEKYKGQKLTNEQVAEVVSAACFVSSDYKINLKENLHITNDLKEICSQFRSGGTAKEGRGILDEYYTQDKIVDAVHNLIKDHFKTQKEISVLEPSVGTGNFIYATHALSVNSKITGFEINETTAKIAKILHPEVEINLRSFETEFIDDRGNRKDSKDFSEKYDLVIGNPPYGEHRGFYKGLGEEPKISKYEDYFVKRSLDSLKPNGVLAMVLPSSWLNRQKNLQNASVLDGFRLPNGAFAGTHIGTDIIILKKNNHNISSDISNYFDNNPARILGETREKTNRFGRLENYIHGNLDEALFKIDQFENKKETQRIGNLFKDLFLEEEPKVENKVPVPKKGNTEIEDCTRIENQNENEVNVIETQEKIELVLSKLNNIKFKSPTITNEISKYEKLREDLITKPTSFS